MNIKLWRMYPIGQVKDETHVLGPHYEAGVRYCGYDGDVEAWSEYNKDWRPGCAQIVQRGGAAPTVIYQGMVDLHLTDDFVSR